MRSKVDEFVKSKDLEIVMNDLQLLVNLVQLCGKGLQLKGEETLHKFLLG